LKFLALFLLLAGSLQAAWQDPWSAAGLGFEDWTAQAPARRKEAWERLAVKDTPEPEVLWATSLAGADLLWIYQHTLSGRDGSHCPYYPSCSRYARIAVEHYGLIRGSLMAGDRLIRCNEHPNQEGHYALRLINGEEMIWDPPMLDAWWESKP
jgi:putative component of membrane protein insertase Oxa1/YidC/SpoIIIJ protein YidD